MKLLLIAVTLLVITFTNAQSNKYKNEVIDQEIFGSSSGFTMNAGISVWGSEITLGGKYNSTYGEWYFAYHLFDYESDEQLWNKPTSGGFLLGLNFVFNYATESRLKYIIGFGSQILKERLSNEAYYAPGDPKDGYFQGYEIHGGLRYFVTKHLFLTRWLGIFVSQDKGQTMLAKKPEYGTEDYSVITLDYQQCMSFN